MEHDVPSFPTASSSNQTKDEDFINNKCLLTIVHSLICHQNQINDKWYIRSIDSIVSSNLLWGYIQHFDNHNNDDNLTNEEIQLAAHAVFCEIVLLASWSCGIQALSFALDWDLNSKELRLPSWEEVEDKNANMEEGRLYLRFKSLLRKIRQEDSKALAPYFEKVDVDTTSVEYAKVPVEIWEKLSSGPWICASFVPMDLVPFVSWITQCYLSGTEIFLSWGELDTEKHCRSVMRRDVETVAGAVAAEKRCDF